MVGRKGGSRIGIVIVAFNHADFLRRCITSIRSGTYPDFEIIVADNSLTGEVRDEFAGDPLLVYLPMEGNLGFCEATNRGMAKAADMGCDFVLLLNHDTVLDPRCLEVLARRAETLDRLGALTGKILHLPESDLLWYAGGYFSRLIGAGKNFGFNRPDDGMYDGFREVTYSTGCLMLVPVSVFKAVGGLDPRLFMYLDDIEFCLRVRKAGYRIYYEPGARVHHELGSGATLSKRPDYYLYFSIRNKPLIIGNAGYRLYIYGLTVLIGLVKMAQFAFLPGIPARASKLRALAWGLVDCFSDEPRYRKRFPRLFPPPSTGSV